MLIGSYSHILVATSYVVAALASFVALDVTARIRSTEGRASRRWLICGSIVMGVGIWSMHFIGMLAFRLPIPQGYDLLITIYSLLIGIAASGYALHLVSRPVLHPRMLITGAIALGAGIASMHYVGMAALRIDPGIDYDPAWFALSIVIAIAAAGAALWIAYRLRAEPGGLRRNRVLASMVMAFAIVGMHYTGMAAAHFPNGSICLAAIGDGVSQQWLASLVGTSTFAILGLALVVSTLDRRLQERTAVLASSLRVANDRLSHMALHDALTDLPNRILLDDRLRQAIEKARRGQSRFAVMFVDLDGFKEINDAYGHSVGDRMLVQVARGIGQVIRAQDTLARVGGDEFVLLLDVTAAEDAAFVAEKLQCKVCEPLHLDSGDVFVSASIGIAIYPDNGATARELLACADAAMYVAKEQGRRGYRFFEVSMDTGAHDQLALLQDLRSAVARDELFLHFQPKLKSSEGPLIGVEGLLRWKHPTRGLIAPDRFIALAEKNGLMIDIARCTLDKACAQMAEWRYAGINVPNVAINLSATQFLAPALPEMIRSALQAHGVPARALTLEVTESIVMRDSDASLAIFRELADIGVRTSIAHFGIGFSSLMYLQKLSATELKIDQRFIRNLVRDGDSAAVISSIVALGRSLDLDVIAEGVETSEQRDLLNELGCTAMQGYYMGRPAAPSELAASGATTICHAAVFRVADAQYVRAVNSPSYDELQVGKASSSDLSDDASEDAPDR
ncbi:MAG: EAL domain-containing protein [Rhodanobacteraceae bacterium]